MKRRRLQALTIASLVTTAAIAPLAFRFGITQGQAQAAQASQIGDNLADAASLARQSGDCDLLGHPSAVSRPGAEIDCTQYKGDAPPPDPAIRTAFAGAERARRQAAPAAPAYSGANDAEARAANTQNDNGGLANPFSLALAPDAQNLPGANVSDPNFPGAGGLPLIFSPNQPGAPGDNSDDPGAPGATGPDAPGPTQPGPNQPNPGLPGPDLPDEPPIDDEPPILVTPIPSALPLIITGVIGLWAASGRRKPKNKRS